MSALSPDESTNKELSRSRLSQLVSWGLLFGALVVLGLAINHTFFASTPRGEWRPDFEGNKLRQIRLESRGGSSVSVSHPAILTVVNAQCRFCTPALEMLYQHMAETERERVPVYVVARSLPQIPTELDSDDVRITSPLGPNPSLAFVEETPTFLRTDNEGRILDAFVGIPSQTVLRRLFSPDSAGRRASAASQGQ